jgi:hypothetical protein
MTDPGRPHLRLVSPKSGPPDTDDLDDLWIETDGDDPLLGEPAAPKERGAEPRPKRLPRGRGYFARVPFPWLAVSERNGGYPAWVRLHLCLWFRSHEGKRPVRLTNEMAAEARLDRQSKFRRLRMLESRGLVSVVRSGKKVPLVTVHSPPQAAALATRTTTVRDADDNSDETRTTTVRDGDDNRGSAS